MLEATRLVLLLAFSVAIGCHTRVVCDLKVESASLRRKTETQRHALQIKLGPHLSFRTSPFKGHAPHSRLCLLLDLDDLPLALACLVHDLAQDSTLGFHNLERLLQFALRSFKLAPQNIGFVGHVGRQFVDVSELGNVRVERVRQRFGCERRIKRLRWNRHVGRDTFLRLE